MQNAAIYIRVSTDDQLEYSPEAQKRAMLEYASKNEMYISQEHIYVDEGISGRKANKRPAFMKMISAAKSKPKLFDIILVHKFDRFARNREDSVVYKAMLLRECNVKVISITEDLSGGDKTSVILEAMLEAMAEYYSLNLSEEVKKGMTVKAERGEIQTSPPFGYNVDTENKKLVINEAEAEIIKMIFSDYLSNVPVARITKKINSMGIKTKRGNKFEHKRICYILNNPVYIGKLRWTPTGKTYNNFNNPDSLIVQSIHEPIITEEQFETAQKTMKNNKKSYARHNADPKYFLTGLVKCSTCGSNLSYAASTNSLQCYKYAHGLCDVSHSISINKLEKALKLCISRDIELGGINVDYVSINSTNNGINFENQIAKSHQKLERANEAYLNGIYDIEYLKKIKQDIEQEIKALNNQKKERNQAVNTNKFDSAKIAQNAIRMFDEKLSIDEKRSIATSTISRITYDKSENKLEIYYKSIL